MNQFKRAQVIMLPTKNKSKLVLTSTPILTLLTNEAIYDLSEVKSQHLYIISDDEIKEGDLHITSDHSGFGFRKYKIIATTDTSLFTLADCPVRGSSSNVKYILPQPSQQFIEKYIEYYNKNEIITDVLVEYEIYMQRQSNIGTTKYIVSKDNKSYDKLNFDRIPTLLGIKVNPKDNTITIKKLKDSWNREEVIELIKEWRRVSEENRILTKNTFDNWIEKKLIK